MRAPAKSKQLYVKKWADVTLRDRKTAIAMILDDSNAAIEITNVRFVRGRSVYTGGLSKQASIVERIAWGVWWLSRDLVSSLCHVRPDLYERIPDEGSILGHLWEGRPPFILWMRDQLRTDDRRERALGVLAEDTVSAFDAWVEARHYLEVKKRAITQYLSPSSLRVLDSFNPLRPSNRTMPNPILYTGGFETNRRRH